VEWKELALIEVCRERSKGKRQQHYYSMILLVSIWRPVSPMQRKSSSYIMISPWCGIPPPFYRIIFTFAVDDLIYLSVGSSFGISDAADRVRTQAQAALDTVMSTLARKFCNVKLWNTNHFVGLYSPPCPPSLVSNLNSSMALDGPCLSSSSSELVSLGLSIPAEVRSTLDHVTSCLEEQKLELIDPKSVNVIACIVSRMIKAGDKERLRHTFTDLSGKLIRWLLHNSHCFMRTLDK
jgi:hypothetical protein